MTGEMRASVYGTYNFKRNAEEAAQRLNDQGRRAMVVSIRKMVAYNDPLAPHTSSPWCVITEKPKSKKTRTPDEILATGAAWVTESELRMLVTRLREVEAEQDAWKQMANTHPAPVNDSLAEGWREEYIARLLDIRKAEAERDEWRETAARIQTEHDTFRLKAEAENERLRAAGDKMANVLRVASRGHGWHAVLPSLAKWQRALEEK